MGGDGGKEKEDEGKDRGGGLLFCYSFCFYYVFRVLSGRSFFVFKLLFDAVDCELVRGKDREW